VSVRAKARYIFLTLLFYFIAYFSIQSFITVNEYNLSTEIDKLIPFVPQFVWVYHTIVPILLFTAIVLIQRKDVFLSMITALIIAGLTMSVFYVVFPSFYPREPIGDYSLSAALVEMTRMVDGPSNTFPSGHVTFSWILVFFVSLSEQARKFRWAYLLWAVLITTSTLVLKQHFIVDAISGILLASVCYYFAKNTVFERLRHAN
jgi:membrane-associated phospholipid phosphatase